MAVGVSEAEVAARWSDWLLDHNRRATRIALWLVALLHPIFAVLDYLLAPRHWLWLVLANRVLSELFTVVMFRLLRGRFFERHGIALTAFYMGTVAAGISLMVVVMGGFRSPYYAGLSLVMLGAGLLFVWPRRVALLTHGTIVATYVIPNLWVAHRVDVTALTNLLFLMSTAAIVSIGQVFAYRTAREQVVNQLTLERTSANLEKAHEELKRLDRFKSRFFANITHELKTPLALVLSPVELMIDGELGAVTEPQRATLRSVFRNGVKLLKLIADLLDLSRLEESRLRLRVEEHDLVAFLRQLVTQVQPLAARKGVAMTFTTTAPTAAAWCDLERLERVFVNLLSNAAKFTPTGGIIQVTVTADPDSVQVVVSDDGPGFDPALAERLFERFFQVDMEGVRRHGGAGIGLALAREFVDLHGGRIWAESVPGHGASFTVELRRDRAHFRADVVDRRSRSRDQVNGQRANDVGLQDWTSQLASREDFRLIDVADATERRLLERDPDEAGRARTVLIVEDTPDVIRVVHLVLRQHFKVLAAMDGRRGLELASRERPDIIITDLMMPEIDGIELTRRVRADPLTRHIPIVMLTARGDLEDRVAGLDTGVNAYLTKPFAPRELLSTVRSLLDTREATAELALAQQMDSLEVVAGGLAHEINNPLNYVKNAVARIRMDAVEAFKMARDGGGDPARIDQFEQRATRMFKTAESGIARITETVDLMRRYSRDGYSRDVRSHDLWTATADVVALVLPATGRAVTVETVFEGDGHVECVPEEIHQVLTNLVQNAIEAAPDGGGKVTVRGNGTASEVVMRVMDNGPGIQPGDQARLFTPFFTTKSPGRGMGLGLAITWRVVHSLGGTVTVRSEPGDGAAFTVRLPRRQPAYPEDRTALPSVPSRSPAVSDRSGTLDTE